ncbi:MAG: DMT family transporter [Alphaproteobacteria bacterium]|nr:DMT family transporter [Alphaproteobacteria bacterium]
MPTQAPSGSSAALGALYAIGAATVFSTAGLIVRHIGLPAWDVSFWRSVLLIATISPLLVLRWQRVWIDVRSGGVALFFSALALAGSFVFFILALDMAPVANVVMMFGATPFMTAVLARLFLGEPMHRHTLVAMAAAIAGLAISVAGSLRAEALAGMALAILVSLCMSANYVIVRGRRDIGMAPSLVLAGLISGMVAAPFAHPENTDSRQFLWLLALGPGQLAGGLLLYIAALKRLPAGPAALLGLLEPVLGPVWVWAIDGERPGNLTLLGGLIVLGAAAANVWLDSRRATG